MRALAFFACGLCAAAQAPHPSAPAFEVASVKPVSPGYSGGSFFNFEPGGGITIENGDVKGIIQMAFDIQEFQVIGAPAWTASARYTIMAKSSDSDRTGTAGEVRQRARQKLQTLLADRFQFRFHRENRDLTMYHLTIAKNGFKGEAIENAGNSGGVRGGCGILVGTNSTMKSLAYQLSRELVSSVDDQTGLTGRYDFRIEYAPLGPCQPPPGLAPTAGAALALPSIFTAVEEQAGLKLVSRKAPVETIIVDRIERPTGN